MKLVGNGVTVPPIRSVAPPASAKRSARGAAVDGECTEIKGAARDGEVAGDRGVGGQGLGAGAADHQVSEVRAIAPGDGLARAVELDRARRVQGVGGVSGREGRSAADAQRRTRGDAHVLLVPVVLAVKPLRSKVPEATVKLPMSAALADSVLVDPTPLTVRLPYASPATAWRPAVVLDRARAAKSSWCSWREAVRPADPQRRGARDAERSARSRPIGGERRQVERSAP